MMNCKGFGRKLSWSNLRYYRGVFLEVLKKTISQNSRHLFQDLKLGPTEYEAGILTTQP
jgi:hypothetical protein